MSSLRADENAAVKAACRYMKRAWKLTNGVRSSSNYSQVSDMKIALRILDLARVQLEYAKRRADGDFWAQTQLGKKND